MGLPKIGALVPWFGAKRGMAPGIVAELGPHIQYFEPFCGAMCVLFAKEPSRQETVGDLHGDLTNLARVVQDHAAAPRLYDRLQRVLFAEGLVKEAAEILEGSAAPFPPHGSPVLEEHVERAFWYFLAGWMQRNGIAGTATEGGHGYAIAVRWTANGGSPTVRFRNAVESIPAWHARLGNVVIMRRDAFGWVPKIEDAAGVSIYADPPYPAETRSGWDATGATSRYQHEFDHHAGALFGASDDHERLAKMLRAFGHARVVVSAYDCERYRRLYEGWTFIDKMTTKKMHQGGSRERGTAEAPEVLIVNGPSLGRAADG